MKPFLILQLRPNDQASDEEFEAFLKHGGLSKDEVIRVRMDQDEIPEVELENFSAIIVGGGPSCVSDKPEEEKAEQKKFKEKLTELLKRIADADFPYFGACYGLCSFYNAILPGSIQKKYGEPVEATEITLTEAGKADPLLEGVSDTFKGFVGHKESVCELPEEAVLLAKGERCPNQLVRFGKNVYASQFHPELDPPGLITRINIYKHAGYFPPEDADKLIEKANESIVDVPPLIFKRFIDRYRA